MAHFKTKSLLSVAIASCMFLTACGGGNSKDSTSLPPTNASTPSPTTPDTTNPSQSVVLTGKVTNQVTKAPIEGAKINIDGKSVATNKDGLYTFTAANIGSKTIYASAPGYVAQTIPQDLVAGNNTLDVALTPASGTPPTSGNNTPDTSVDNNTLPKFSYTAFGFDMGDNGNITQIVYNDNEFYSNLVKTRFSTVYGTETDNGDDDISYLYLADGVTYIDSGKPDSTNAVEGTEIFNSAFSDANLSTTERLLDKVSGKSIIKKRIYNPISLAGNTSQTTLLNRLPRMKNQSFNFPEGSLCYGNETVDFTNHFWFDLTTPSDYKTLNEWQEQYATTNETRKPTFRTYQLGTKNDATVMTVSIGTSPDILDAIVKYQNMYYSGHYETMPDANEQALTKNNCLVYNSIAKKYMIDEIKKYYK